MKKFKMRVKAGQTAEAIQNYMFACGNKWAGYLTEHENLYAKFFFADGKYITYECSDEEYFNEQEHEEVFFATPVQDFKEVPKHSHYHKDVSHLKTIDVYRVIELWEVTSPSIQHALKKLLIPGGRGAGKDMAKDIQEAIDSLVRWQEMQVENSLAKDQQEC